MKTTIALFVTFLLYAIKLIGSSWLGNVLISEPAANSLARNPEKETEITRALLQKIDIASSIDDVFVVADQIPAIHRMVDKALKVITADDDDALLSVSAIYRMANLTASSRVDTSSWTTELLQQDRRFEQLIDCLELRVGTMKAADLARYLWSLAALEVEDKEQLEMIFNEYLLRSSRTVSLDSSSSSNSATQYQVANQTNKSFVNSSLIIEEAATMLWTMACAKEAFAMTNGSIVGNICEVICSRDLSVLSNRLIVRVIWASAICDVPDAGLLKRAIAVVQSRSPGNLTSAQTAKVLWSLAQCPAISLQGAAYLGTVRDLLDRLEVTVEKRLISTGDVALAGDALLSICDAASSEISTLRSNSTEGAGVRGAARIRISRLEEIVEDVKDAMETLVDCSVDRIEDFPVTSIVNVLRCAVTLGDAYPPQLWDRCVRRLNTLTASPSASACFSPWESASMLELIPFAPRNATVEFYMEKAIWPFPSHLSEVKNDEIPELFPGSRNRNPSWHRLAGRLAAWTCAQATVLKDRNHLINTCWGLACLGHPHRTLLRHVRKNVQHILPELSPGVLSRLVVAVAMEEASGSVGDFAKSGVSNVAKLDRDFVDQVALNVFKTVSEVAPLSNQICSLVAAACLGRLISLDMRTISGKAEPVVPISVEQLRGVPTHALIKLQWAAGRMPMGVVSDDTVKNIQQELRGRELVKKEKAEADEIVSEQDLKLYLRHLIDKRSRSISGGKKNSRSDGADAICKSMLMKVKEQGRDQDVATAVAHLSATESASLCEVLWSFIDLRWFSADALKVMEALCTVQQRDYYKNKAQREEKANVPYFLEISCIWAYQLGRLEELLGIYKTLVMTSSSGLSHTSGPATTKKYPRLRRMQPRLLGMTTGTSSTSGTHFMN